MSGEGMIAEQRSVHGDAGSLRLKQLMHRGTEFLGTEYAILGGAMSWVSERNLVSAITNAGGFGVIACGAMSPELLDTEIAETKKRTTKPFGVNLITMHPQLSELIDVCAQARGDPCRARRRACRRAGRSSGSRRSGAKLIAFAPALALAKKLIRSGADALVIEGMEAGGHIGPVSTSVLCAGNPARTSPPTSRCSSPAGSGAARRSPPISKWARSGSSSARASSARTECIAHANFKKAFIRASARDAIPSVQIDPRLPVIPVRALKNREMVAFRRQAARGRADGSTRARSKWPRPSSRSSIIGPARCAAR